MSKAPCSLCPKPGAFSPSQIKAFEFGCQRKWAFRHILNLPEPSFGFQELGKDIHKHLENYLRDGTIPPDDTKAGEIARTGLDTLPKPDSRHIIEQHLYLEEGDVAFHGFADLLPFDEYAVDDHKSTSSFDYALTKDELKCDPQALIYGMWRLRQEGRGIFMPPLKLRWRYYRTRKPYKTHIVETSLKPHELDENFSRYVLEPALRMRDIRDSATPDFDPNVLPAEPGACNAYGGCPHKSRCSLHQSEMSSMGSLFRDKLAAASKPAAAAKAKDEPNIGEMCGTCGIDIQDGVCGCNVLAQGVVPPDAPEPVKELPPEAEKPKRGRKKKSDTPSAPPPAQNDDGLTLCINTLPMRGRAKLLSEVLSPVIEALSKQLNTVNYRLAEQAGYGRANALLLAAFREAVPKLTGVVYVDERDLDSAAVLSHLEAQATEIFRGVR